MERSLKGDILGINFDDISEKFLFSDLNQEIGVDSMYYCPNCSAILADPNSPTCPKCGFDRITARLEEEERMAEKMTPTGATEEVPPSPDVVADAIDARYHCPICNSGLSKIRESQISFDLLGKEVSIHNIRIMGMNLHKRAITQCIVTFDGYVCDKNHKFFTRFTQSYRELCPICRDTMRRFGREVRTCSRCHINISGEYYVTLGGRELLEDEGWIYKPELLADD